MRAKAGLFVGFLFMFASAYGQSAVSWPCSDDPTKAVRVSVGVAETLVQKKILPDVSDLKRTKTNSTVIIRILIGKDGAVRCADAMQGDADLFARSLEAAKQWRYKPYLLNGQPIIVDTRIEFVFKKGNVTAR
jgi:protein TonB